MKPVGVYRTGEPCLLGGRAAQGVEGGRHALKGRSGLGGAQKAVLWRLSGAQGSKADAVRVSTIINIMVAHQLSSYHLI